MLNSILSLRISSKRVTFSVCLELYPLYCDAYFNVKKRFTFVVNYLYLNTRLEKLLNFVGAT